MTNRLRLDILFPLITGVNHTQRVLHTESPRTHEFGSVQLLQLLELQNSIPVTESGVVISRTRRHICGTFQCWIARFQPLQRRRSKDAKRT